MSKSILDRLNYLIALISEFAAAHHISAQQPYLYLRQFKGLTPGGLYYCKRFYLLYNQLFEKVPQVEEKSLSETDSESATLSTKKVPQLGEIFKPLHSATAQANIFPLNIFAIPWGHHKVLIDRFEDEPQKALFYVAKTLEHSWSRATLLNTWLLR